MQIKAFNKYLFLLYLLCMYSGAMATKLYWVGNTGNFTDPQHWSLTSGGSSNNLIPNANDDLIFDEKSFNASSVIYIVGNPSCNSLTLKNIPSNVYFVGSSNEILSVYENISFQSSVNWNFSGAILLTGSKNSTLNTGINSLSSNLIIEKGNARIDLDNSLSLNQGASIFLKSGELFSNNHSIFCNEFIKMGSGIFKLSTTNFLISATGKMELNSSFLDLSSNTELQYAINDASKDFVNENDFPNFKIIDNASSLSMPATATVVDSATCNGDCDGSVLVTFSGPGTAPYTITFTAGTVTTFSGVLSSPFLATNLCAGNYTVRVFNSLNQQIGSAANVLIYEPSVIAVNFNQFTNPLCFGDCTGQILFDIIGGNPTYTAVWQPSNNTFNSLNSSQEDSIENLCNGYQVVNIQDRKGCIGKDSFLIVQPGLIIPNGGFTNQLCFGQCDGTVFVSPSGGTPFLIAQANGIFYQTIWDGNPALNNDTLYDLCPGIHTVIITDSNGCDTTLSITVNPNTQLTFTTSGNLNLACFDVCNGSAQVNAVSGGTTPYSFAWNGPTVPTLVNTATSSSATNLCAGTYSCTITDANGCDTVVTFNIVAPPLLVANVITDDPDCNQGTNGSAIASSVGGTGAVNFSWFNTLAPPPGPAFSTGSTVSNISVGSYTLIAVDANGCNDTLNFNINEPLPIVVTINPTNPLCFGQSNGDATAVVSGGTPIPPGNTYSYSWNSSPVQTTQTATGLPAGSYTVTVTDNNGCTESESVILSSPTQINNNLITTTPSCFGSCDGTAVSNPNGGSGSGYTFSWTCSPQTTNNVSGLCAGPCALTVTDGSGCTRTTNFVLSQPNDLTVVLNATPLDCNGASTAQISSLVNGGTPGYTFCWNPPACSSTSPGLSNVGAGTYTLQVTDSRNCQETAQVTINSPSAISINLTATNPTCFGVSNGSIVNTVNGGTPNYTFQWLPINVTTQSPSPNSLGAGTYTVNVIDALGCTATQTIQLISPDQIIVSTDSIEPTCVGQCDGAAVANATGGNAGTYSFSWSTNPIQTNATANSLCPGTYTVTVTDVLGCTGTGIAQVTQPTALTVSISNINASCNICNGSATFSGNGGVPPYTISVDGLPSSNNPTNLCAGTHTVVLTDANNCSVTSTFVVPQQVGIIIDATISTLTCNGDCNGVATANVSGGTGQLTFSWNSPAPTTPTNQTTSTATGLCAGIHTVTVTDQLGCSSTETVTFTDPALLIVSSTSTPVACTGAAIGTASVTPSGGVTPYSVVWSNGQLGNSISNLSPGTYIATITDANGCTENESITISTAPSISITSSIIPPSGCGLADGSVSVTPSGGSGSFNFSWSNPPGGASNSITNVSAGSYTVTITDAITGCDTVIPLGISDPSGPLTSQTVTDATCNSICNGSGTVDVVSGISPLLVTWPNGGNTGAPPQSQNALCAGIYAVEVEDGNGCVTVETLIINEPDEFLGNPTVTSPLCNGDVNGSIIYSPQGGTAPFTYSINSAPDDSSMTGLAAGTYTVIATDAVGCINTQTFNLIAPTALNLNLISTNIGCNGPNSGSASFTAVGGTLPYSQQWISSSGVDGTGITISNLSVATYTLQITDANNCLVDTIFSITQNPALVGNFTSANNLCSFGCTGSAEFQPSGGSGVYNFSWNTNPTQTTQSITNLCPGIYTGVLSDDVGCSITETFTVLPAPSITINFTSTLPLCNGDCNGTATAIVSGGTGNISYSWSPNQSNSATATNLCTGVYILSITDENNCSNSQTLNLTEPTILNSNVSSVLPTCFQDCDGLLIANPIGGTAPYTFDWLVGLGINDTLANLCSDDYSLVVSDANNCRDTVDISLAEPPQVNLIGSTTAATCGQCDGSITINNITGNSIIWLSPLSGNSLTQNNLCAGTYSVVVSDANNCSDTVIFSISNSNGPLVNVDSTNSSCFGTCDGTATVVSVSGNAPFTYSWGQGLADTDSIVTGLCAGTYLSQVTDIAGCITFTGIVVNEPDQISITESVTDASCFGLNDGVISLTTSGGTFPYTFQWSNGAPDSLAIVDLAPGSYSVTITDFNSCSSQFNFIVGSNIEIVYDIIPTQITCFGDCNGSVELNNINGGLPPYQILWNDPVGQSGSIANNLCSGSIQATILDAQGCSVIADTILIEPSQVIFNSTVINSTCGQCNGSITISPIGGTSPYNFLWSNGSVNSALDSVCSGVYMAEILDANNCRYQENIFVNDSSETQFSVTVTNETCFNSCDGAASVSVTSGDSPFLFNWLPGGQNSSTITNLCSGIYYVQVRDEKNCLTTDSVTISGPSEIISNQTVVAASCGSCNGQIILNPAGGSGSGYSYVWSSGLPANSSQTNVCAGIYSVQITDGSGCFDTLIVALNSTNGPLISVVADSVSCNGLSDGTANISINGGVSPYIVNWSNGSISNPSVSGLSAGNYAVSVSDALNCVSNQFFVIEEPAPIAFSLASTQLPDCEGVCNGTLLATPIGGTLLYNYNWSNNLGNSNSVSGLCSGSYSVTVTDGNGCSASQTSIINDNPEPFSTGISVSAPTCGECNGSISLTINGGLSPYTLNWTTGDTLTSLVNICAGVYQVSITDANGCDQTSTFPVNNDVGITGETIIVQNESCPLACDGSATISAIGGTAPITYQWLNSGVQSQSQNNLCAGTYFVLMTDSNNCSRTTPIDILSPSQMNIVPLVVNPTCNNADGSISFNGVSGGIPPYFFSWSPPVVGNVNVANGLTAGVYSVTITDNANPSCSQTFTISLSTDNGPLVEDSLVNVSCSGQCTGEIYLTITSSTSTTVSWSTGSTASSIGSLCEGNYSVSVTDANGCVSNETFSLQEPDSFLIASDFISDPSCFGLCNGSITVLPVGGSLPYSFNWSGLSSSIAIADSICVGPTTLNIIDANNCIISETFNLSQPDSISVIGLITNTPCSSVSNGSIDISVNGGSPTYSFQWAGLVSDTTEDVSNLSIGSYTVLITDANNCSDSALFEIFATDTVIAAAGLDSVLCDVDSLSLDGSNSFSNNGNLVYNWVSLGSGDTLGNDSTLFIDPLPGVSNYLLIVSNQNGCSDADSVIITTNALPFADAGPDTSIISGQSITIGGSPTGPPLSIFNWSPSISLNDSLSSNPISSATVTTQYAVLVTDENGCSSVDTMELRIDPEVFIPNGISPNADGKNDFWVINNLDRFPDNEVEIYNRWGELLYYRKNYDNKWDGSYNGKPLPIGTYYYVLKLNDPKFEEAFTGPLTIFK